MIKPSAKMAKSKELEYYFVSPASYTQNIGRPSIVTPSKMGKTKNLTFYSQLNQHTAPIVTEKKKYTFLSAILKK